MSLNRRRVGFLRSAASARSKKEPTAAWRKQMAVSKAPGEGALRLA